MDALEALPQDLTGGGTIHLEPAQVQALNDLRLQLSGGSADE